MEDRTIKDPIAATKIDEGTDVNFGALNTYVIPTSKTKEGRCLLSALCPRYLKRISEGLWEIKVKDINGGKNRNIDAKFVFVGAGGGSSTFIARYQVFLNQSISVVSL